MEAIALKAIRVRTTGQEFLPGDHVEAPPEKLLQWSERGLVQIVGETVQFDSPLFGRLEGIILEQGPDTFTLRHPLTQEIVKLPNEWLVSLDERAAILEFDGGLPREEADKEARIEFFQLFRKGGPNANRG